MTPDEQPEIPKAEQLARFNEWFKCRTDFLYWLISYVTVLDKTVRSRVPFRPYNGQVEIVRNLIEGKWVWCLKSRRLGATAILIVYSLHEMTFYKKTQVIMVSQDKPTAADLVTTFNDMDLSQPEWMRQARTVDNTERVVYRNQSSNRILAGSPKTARSLDADILILDEAAFMQYLKEALAASIPTLETSGGVIAVMSTSAGPGDEFEGQFWKANGPYRETESIVQGGNFHQIFLSWRERPGRDDAWRARMQVQLGPAADQEFPSDPQQAFAAAGGRMFPSFSRSKHIVEFERPSWAKLYRGMDFGSSPTSAFVCIWAWHDNQAEIPRLTFEPACEVIEESPETIGEFAAGLKQMIAYARDDKTGRRIKLNDDLPDALRYMVTTFGFFGHVHVYKLLFMRSGSDYGSIQYSMMDWFREVQLMSGWELIDESMNLWKPTTKTEYYAGTVGDRAGKGYMNLLREQQTKGGFDLRIIPHKRIPDVPREEEVEQGVQWVNCLLNGVTPIHAEKYESVSDGIRGEYLAGQHTPVTIMEKRKVSRLYDMTRPQAGKRRLIG